MSRFGILVSSIMLLKEFALQLDILSTVLLLLLVPWRILIVIKRFFNCLICITFNLIPSSSNNLRRWMRLPTRDRYCVALQGMDPISRCSLTPEIIGTEAGLQESIRNLVRVNFGIPRSGRLPKTIQCFSQPTDFALSTWIFPSIRCVDSSTAGWPVSLFGASKLSCDSFGARCRCCFLARHVSQIS